MIQNKFTPIPNDTLILGADRYFSMDGKKTHINNNTLIVGRSGSGKSRYFVKPNLLQLNGSYVVSDPKGQLYKEFKDYFEANGYEVIHMDFIHPSESAKYNPFQNLYTTNDVRSLAHTLVFNDKNARMNDPYWENMGELLLMGLIGYIWESPYLKRTEKNISMLQDLIMKCNRDSKTIKPGERNLSEMDTLMDKHKQRIAMVGYESWAYKQYQKAASAPNRTFQTILSTCFSKLVIFDSNEIANMTSENGFRFDDLGKRKIALFVEVSDTDRSMDILSNLFYSQLINSLCSYADEKCENGALPIPVQFILDDFSTNVKIDNFDNTISNIRSRNISTMLMIQDIAQLKATYGESASTIISNCANILYLGGTYESANMFSKWANKAPHEFLNLPLDTGWLFRTVVLCQEKIQT